MKTAQQTSISRSRCTGRRTVRGMTLIESSIALCVVAIAAGATLPSFKQARERRHLEGIAAQVATDVQLARSLAVSRAESVRISFSNAGGASCYVVHTGTVGACRCATDGAPVCTNGATPLQTVRLGAELAVQVSSNAGSMLFDGNRGTVTPTATIKVQSPSASIHQVVNVMGRVRTCSPAATVPGYTVC